MKKGYIYTIAFMFVVSVFFTGALAIANEATAETIEKNKELSDKKAVLNSMDIAYEDDDAKIEELFSEKIKEIDYKGYKVYEEIGDNGELKTVSILFQGTGLWGSIKGFIAVSAEFDKLVGIEFTEQNETPGLGSRITEAWFKDQFKGIELGSDKIVEYGNGLDAISGATSTSNAILKILNSFIKNDLPVLEVMTK